MPHKKRRNDDVIAGNFSNWQLNSSDDSDKNQSFQCSICDYTAIRRSNLRKHTYTHTLDKPHKCEICSESFIKKRSYKKHMQFAHAKKFPYECPTCGDGFERADELQRHESRSNIYQCAVCAKTFKHRRDHLVRHMRTHTHKKQPNWGSFENGDLPQRKAFQTNFDQWLSFTHFYFEYRSQHSINPLSI